MDVFSELRSEESEPLLVRFINCHDRAVDVLWVTYNPGEFLVYRSLGPGQYVDAFTYVRHPWVFKEKESGTFMWANNKRYFRGIDDDYTTSNNGSRIGLRYIVCISRPLVRRLRTICINYLCGRLKRCSDVKYLEIPVMLKRDIIRKMHARVVSLHANENDRKDCENVNAVLIV